MKEAIHHNMCKIGLGLRLGINCVKGVEEPFDVAELLSWESAPQEELRCHTQLDHTRRVVSGMLCVVQPRPK